MKFTQRLIFWEKFLASCILDQYRDLRGEKVSFESIQVTQTRENRGLQLEFSKWGKKN